jgi:hypothetical protein
MKYKMVLFVLLLKSMISYSQNTLSGVYVNIPYIIDGDTVYSSLQGKVIDSLSRKPVPLATMELSSSRGDVFSVKTDSNGNFKLSPLPDGCMIRIVCAPNSKYKIREWNFSTEGMKNPIQLKMVFELLLN